MPLPTIPSGNVASATASTSFDVDNSSRWDNASSMKMTRTPSSTGNSKTWTFSMWIKIGQIGTEYVLFHNYGSSGTSEVFVKYQKNKDINVVSKGVFYNEYGKILLLKITNDTAYDLPGWHLHFGESIEQGLYRECFE